MYFPPSAASASASASSAPAPEPDIRYMQANLQRATARSDPRRLQTFFEQIDQRQPDFVFVQEVGEDFRLDGADTPYELVHMARNPMVTGRRSQLNVAVFQREDSPVVRRSVQDQVIERRFDVNRPVQRRRGIEMGVRAAGRDVTFLVVHADASESGGLSMLDYFNTRAERDPRFIGVGDLNADLTTLGERNAVSDPFRRIAAARRPDGSFAPTHVSVRDGEERFSALDFAYHGDGLRVDYDDPVRATHTRSLKRPRAASMANATDQNLVDHFMLHAGVHVVSLAEAERRPASRPMPVRLLDVAPEDRAMAAGLKAATRRDAGVRLFAGARDTKRRRQAEEELAPFVGPAGGFSVGVSTPSSRTTRRTTTTRRTPLSRGTGMALDAADD